MEWGETISFSDFTFAVGYLVVPSWTGVLGVCGVCGGKLEGLDPGGVVSCDVAVRETAQVWVVV